MTHGTPTPAVLQSLLFAHDELKSCLLRQPSARELEFLQYFQTVRSLLSSDERRMLGRHHRRGRNGYALASILGIMLLKLLYQQRTMKQTLLLLHENGNLKDMLAITEVPSEATVSRLSREVEQIVPPSSLHGRVVQAYAKSLDRLAVGHLSIDSTVVEAREKPVRTRVPKAKPPKKRGRKAKGSLDEQQHRERQAQQEQERIAYLQESFETSLGKLELRCSVTAKQNSKGKKQWFIGYKAHLATDDHGVPMSFAVTGASVHDSQVAVPLMKKTRETADFLYALLDKGYISPVINDYVGMIGRKAIIDRRAYKGVVADPLDQASQQRYGARTTVERTNSELKDGYLPDVIYKRGCHARYEIALSVLLTTMKKVRNVLMLYEQHNTRRAS
ncbi:MAG: transposase [Sphaerochaetaceae bacterium]